MFDNLKWEKLGTVAVDSGTLMVVDPCYVLPDHKRYPSDMPVKADYKDMLDAYETVGFDSLTVEPWGEAFGMCIGTTYGDGVYNVWGVKQGDKITHWMVVTGEDEDDENEDEETCEICGRDIDYPGETKCDRCLESEGDDQD